MALIVLTAVGASFSALSTPGVGIVILSMVPTTAGFPAADIALITSVEQLLDMILTPGRQIYFFRWLLCPCHDGPMLHSTAWLAILFVLLWNSGFISAEYLLPHAGPFTQLFWRYLTLALILLAYLAFRGCLCWPGWSTAAPEALIGILAHGVWLACALVSIAQGVPAGIVALVVALQPLTVGALSGVVVGEHTLGLRWLGLVLGFAGVTVVVLPRVNFGDAASLSGYFIPLGAVASMTAVVLMRRRMEVFAHLPRLPLDLALFYQALASALVLFFPAILAEGLATHWTAGFLAGTAWLVLAVSLGAYALMFELLGRMDATGMSALFYLGPPVTMFMAWAAFGDALQPVDFAGLAILCLGVVVVQWHHPGEAPMAKSK
jgi:drug/metabolite transporter (DMT)-like permease